MQDQVHSLKEASFTNPVICVRNDSLHQNLRLQCFTPNVECGLD